MKSWGALCVWASTAFVATAGCAAAQTDDSMLDELNFARTHPYDYARELRREASSNAQGERVPGLEFESRAAITDTIDFLSQQPPLQPLSQDATLTAVAQAYVIRQGPTGEVGHVGPSGESLGERLKSQGSRFATAGETIAYGEVSAHDAVRQLIIDSNVPDRGHRKIIFDASFTAAGASCGPHRVYRTMCVIDFGGSRLSQ